MEPNTEESRQAFILDFWFGNLKEGDVPCEELSRMWWANCEETDEYIRVHFESDLKAAKGDRIRGWEKNPRGTLALLVLLDQFSRNMYRGTAGAFSQDSAALEIAASGIENGYDKDLHPVMRVFFYMPFMHSEDLEMQKRSIAPFAALERDITFPHELAEMLSINSEYARRHYAIIERFGRYPHRNRILGRESTPEEFEFLKQPGSSF